MRSPGKIYFYLLKSLVLLPYWYHYIASEKYLDTILSREEYGGDDGRDAAKGDGLFLFPELSQDPGEVVVNDRVFANPEGGQVLGGAKAAGDDDGGEVVDGQILWTMLYNFLQP
jgi:hypothetical protein